MIRLIEIHIRQQTIDKSTTAIDFLGTKVELINSNKNQLLSIF